MDPSIRPRTSEDPVPCPFCGTPVVTGRCSACGREQVNPADQTDAMSERQPEEAAC